MKFFALACVTAALLLATPSTQAAQTLRQQVDQRGDFVLIGNTGGWDCNPGGGIPAPIVGAIGACGTNVNDTAIDLLWRGDSPAAGQAAANNTITPAQARSTAVLAIPAGASITYARLYWAASNNTIGTTVTLEHPISAFTTVLTADVSYAGTLAGGTTAAYEASADITTLVQTQGLGAYRVGNIPMINPVGLNDSVNFVAWSMVVFYALPSDPPRNLALFDGFDLISGGVPSSATISGFLVPNAGFSGHLGLITYEGDASIVGDQFSFGGVFLSDAQNPVNNFFNGTRSLLGLPVTVVGDLPQLSGAPASMLTFDLDTIDVTARLVAGQTSATIAANSTGDVYALGAFVTSISTLKPVFTNTQKTFVDLTGAGGIYPGDLIEYTITTSNTGSDTG
ncbi:MAG: hypothetical protein WCJ30_11095, partial [Deltaproteobacteria bacterium]